MRAGAVLALGGRLMSPCARSTAAGRRSLIAGRHVRHVVVQRLLPMARGEQTGGEDRAGNDTRGIHETLRAQDVRGTNMKG
jgi:hypothetical protein